MSRIQLIVGLGNPGPEYQDTRHNAGVWLVERFGGTCSVTFKSSTKFQGQVAHCAYEGERLHFLLPRTFMNLSGQSVAAYAGYYKIPVEQILTVHDELDLVAGVARFKQGGGAGGHNGVLSVIRSLGNNQGFNRLRIGIGHPGGKERVIGHVLKRAASDEQTLIDQAIDDALEALPLALRGEWQAAMSQLHSRKRNTNQSEETSGDGV